MSFQIRNKKPQNPLAVKLGLAQKKVKWLKIRLFLLITLPIAVVSIGHAVIREYVKIRVRQAARDAKAEHTEALADARLKKPQPDAVHTERKHTERKQS